MTWLKPPSCVMTQVLVHDCQEMKDETRNMGAVAVPLTEEIRTHSRNLSPESSTDQSELGSRMRKRKAHMDIHMDSHYTYTVWHAHSMI